MQWSVPNVSLSREPTCVSCSPVLDELGVDHVPCPADFCVACGTDLRVKRLLVSVVGFADAWRLYVCEVAERDGPSASAERERLQMSRSDRLRLVDLLYEGCTVYEYGLCGLVGTTFVGVGEDGALLYARPCEYDIGPILCLRDP